jgi:hypothetical protein
MGCHPSSLARLAAATALCLVAVGRAWGQVPPDAPGFRLGSFRFAPAVSFSSGWTSNINSESPAVDAYENTPHLHLGFTTGGGRVEMDGFGAIEFARYSVKDESGHSSHASVQVRTTGPGLRVGGSYFLRNGQARPTGFEEISLRSQRIENKFDGWLEVPVGPRMWVRGGGLFSATRYSADALYQGSSLDDLLTFNRAGASAALGFNLTSLTRFSIRGDWVHDNYLKGTRVDTDNGRVVGGLEFDAPALLTGSAYFGWMKVGSPDLGVPGYTGFSMGGTLTYARQESTLVIARLSREPSASVDQELSYYVSTLVDIGWRQDLFGPVELFTYASWLKLNYPGTADTEGDDQFGVGGALAVRIGRLVRVGIDVDTTERIGRNPWSKQRIVGFITYGSGFRQVERPLPVDRYR